MQPEILFAIGALVGYLLGLATALVIAGARELSRDDAP